MARTDSGKGPIDPAYWLRRWKEGNTGWHQDAPEPALLRHFGDLKNSRVLVPLCGKSIDVAWFASRGNSVVGVELSELAIETFFREQELKFEKSKAGPYQRYDSGKITILHGDFFQLTPQLLGPFDALYDRAALVALPPDLRARYVAQVRELVQACGSRDFRFLLLVFEQIPHDELGPPFSITEAMVRSYYEPDFKIELFDRENSEIEAAPGARVDHCVYGLARR